MIEAGGVRVRSLKVDGGAAANDFLLQFQADLLQAPVVRPRNLHSTAMGAAFLAGLGAGVWASVKDLVPRAERVFRPRWPRRRAEELFAGWKEAVRRVLTRPGGG